MPDDSTPQPSLSWVREESPVWDADKARIIGGAPEGTFVLDFADGQELPGDWWAAVDDGTVVGYGRLDTTWGGDAEILLAVAPDRQEAGVGTFVLDHLDEEAAARGLNYVANRIREHEKRDLVHDWLVVRGFRGPVDGDLRKRVGTTHGTPSTRGPATPPPPPTPPSSSAGSGAGHSSAKPRPDAGSVDQPPGREEQGGYVDVEEHQY